MTTDTAVTTPTDATTTGDAASTTTTEGTVLTADTAATTTAADIAKGDEAASTTKDGETKPETAEVDYKFEVPEGVTLDEARTTEFVAIAKELKLPKESAQKVVDLAVKHEQARAEAHVAQVGEWAAAVKADKDLGGDKLGESRAVAKKAIDLGPPELKQFLNDTGLGNHPAIFRWAHAVGKAMSEDNFVQGTKAPAGPVKSQADRLYPSSAAKTGA